MIFPFIRATFSAFKKLPPVVQFFVFGQLINSMGVMIVPYMSLVLVHKIGLSPSQAGGVLAVYAVGTILAVIFAGRLTDRLGRKPILLMSLFGGGAMALLLSQISSPVLYVVTLVSFGFLMECYRPASGALIADLVPDDQRAPALAALRAAMNLGYMIAVVFGGLIVEWNWRGLFWIDAATTFMFGAVVLMKVPMRTAEPTGFAAAGQPAFQNREFMKLWIASFLLSYVYSTHGSLVPLSIVQEGGYPERVAGFLLGINGAMVGLFEIGVSARLGSVSPIKRMTVGSALVVAGLAITTVSTHWVWFAFSIVVWSVGEILSFAIMSAYTSRLAPADRRGEYFGWIQSSWRLAGVLGPASLMASYEFLGAKTFWPALLVPGIATVWAFTRLGPSSHSHGGTHGPNLPQGLKRLTDRNFV